MTVWGRQVERMRKTNDELEIEALKEDAWRIERELAGWLRAWPTQRTAILADPNFIFSNMTHTRRMLHTADRVLDRAVDLDPNGGWYFALDGTAGEVRAQRKELEAAARLLKADGDGE